MYDAFIIARLNSSRLVRKNVMPILDLPMIIHLANRIKLSEYVDRIIITTSNQETDDELDTIIQTKVSEQVDKKVKTLKKDLNKRH